MNAELIFSCHPASEHYEGANETSLDFQHSALQILREYVLPNKAVNSLFLSEGRETLVHAFSRDFPAYILHTAVPVLTIIFLIHAMRFLSLLGCQNY